MKKNQSFQKKKVIKTNDTVINMNDKKIEKSIRNDIDPECHDGLKWLIERFKNDTLTGK
ncbi:MAG: hypothetical protein JW982_13200 [Spirochaetes bacterium]|nr:hypothetical protein [Spirochaetota bacterium]